MCDDKNIISANLKGREASQICRLLLISVSFFSEHLVFHFPFYHLSLPCVLPLWLPANLIFPSGLCPEDTDSHGGIRPGGH